MQKVIISKALKKKLEKIGCPVSKKLLEAETDNINYLGLSRRDPGRISYLDSARLGRHTAFKRWYSNIRYDGRPAKVAGVFVDSTPQELEAFSTKFMISNNQKDNVKLLSGEKIRWGYLAENYYEHEHSLGDSCMKYMKAQKYLDIYCKNPDYVNLAVILKDNLVQARCIIWFPNTIEDKSIIYFDRVYACSRDIELSMISMLTNRGYIQISDKNDIKPSIQVPVIQMKLPKLSFDYYPYMDTLTQLCSHYITNNKSEGQCMQCTDGTIEEDTCDRCGCDLHEEGHYIENGNFAGSYLCSDCSVYSEVEGSRYCIESVTYCEYQEDYVRNGDIIRLSNGDSCYEEYDGLMIDIRGNYFIDGDSAYIQPEGSEDWYPKYHDDLEEIDGLYYIIDSEEYLKIKENELETA